MSDSTFARDIHTGLSAAQKYISSRYFYDDAGSVIFQEIMQMPEYYPTRSEFEILSMQSDKIIAKLDFQQPFNIVEFGAGDGMKTRQLLKKLIDQDAAFSYMPIDISRKAIDELEASMLQHLPQLKIRSVVGNYFSVLETLAGDDTPSLFLFLGGNIGNYEDAEVHDLMRAFGKSMKPGDKLLTGFDLRKNPALIRNAYDDPAGITKRFNMNLLHRMNRELGGNIVTSQFDFYSFYNPVNGEVRSYLVSLAKQRIHLSRMDKCYDFEANELISTELSRKYTLPEIEAVAAATGYGVVEHFLDCRHYFTDSLWVKNSM
ncbi:L-histidine N(alpha)-methyltransferase [Dyadobacter sandarakinus]|uniref:L-histidine N(Alpha)-methyltransferase n=1 Tax=Dyadobacter sandarakinus TaxID=2747268 RepID=A0ABX7I460_9BACT|nr:L-histidine N(alpha)-methyltransferase [Dyadobacter sandarakinus]QRR00523.1 L-histidine N(alpha)-methyltransferase [Dyadobacter sandarakinus]